MDTLYLVASVRILEGMFRTVYGDQFSGRYPFGSLSQSPDLRTSGFRGIGGKGENLDRMVFRVQTTSRRQQHRGGFPNPPLLNVQVRLGNTDDRKPVPDLLASLFGKVFGARGYVSRDLAEKLLEEKGIEFFAKPRRNMKNLGVAD